MHWDRRFISCTHYIFICEIQIYHSVVDEDYCSEVSLGFIDENDHKFFCRFIKSVVQHCTLHGGWIITPWKKMSLNF